MLRYLAWLCLLFAAVAIATWGCARDTNDEDAEERYPNEVKLAFRTQGSLRAANWYFMVFNFTAAPSTTAATAPIDIISDIDRARNWELYVAINPSNVGGDSIVTLQRPPLPTVLPTAAGPVDVTTALINNDNFTDLVVACRIAGEIQVLAGVDAEPFDTVFFTEAATIANGPQPVRVFADQFFGDPPVDLLVLFAGDDGSTPVLRILAGDGQGLLTAQPDIPLAPGIPVDALVQDFNADGFLDLALVTTQDVAGAGELGIYLGDGEGSFSQTGTHDVGIDPVQVSIGQLGEEGLDLSVACRGTAANDGEIYLFNGTGLGSFVDHTESPLGTPGACTGAVIAKMFSIGTDPLDDVLVGYRDATGTGQLRVFLNNVVPEGESPLPGEAFGDFFVDIESQVQPDFIAAAETSDDDRLDALVLEGAPGSGGNTFMIQRGLVGGEGTEFLFEWDPEAVTYISGLEPSRIHLADIDQNGKIDIITPNSADDEAGNSISLFYGLGKDNFTSADIYWTDELPRALSLEEWYISHVVGPNFFELTLDPGLFYDLARHPPENFLVDFMTATSGIDLVNNLNQEGIVIEHLSQPVNVPMTIGHFNDEQNSPRANTGAIADPAEDIVDWRVEVF